MKIYLIRHGETDYNKNRRIQGQCDIELNDYGRELARITAQGLKDVPFDIVYTSPLKRAKETAEIITGDRNVIWIEDARIQEISFGEYEGRCCSKENFNVPDKAFLNFFTDTANYSTPPGGESFEDIIKRTGEFLTELTGDYNAAELVWSVPKFDVKSSTGLNEALRSLGVTDAFDGTKADFTPLTDNGAVVDSVMQAARVKIDEDGVEAAAYTEIVANDSAMMEIPPTVEMELDRPFLFVIFDYNNVPLFVGTVNTVA